MAITFPVYKAEEGPVARTIVASVCSPLVPNHMLKSYKNDQMSLQNQPHLMLDMDSGRYILFTLYFL